MQGALQGSRAPGIGGDLLDIVAQGRDRDRAAQDDVSAAAGSCASGTVPGARTGSAARTRTARGTAGKLRLSEGGVHLLQVRHGAAHVLLRKFQHKVIGGLQEDGLCHHEALADRPVGRLAEVAALGVLGMGPAADDTDLHIGDLCPGQDAAVAPLLQVGQDQALPVERQVVDSAAALEDQAGPRFPGLQKEMDFRVVAQGFEVADALRRLRDGLFIDDAGGSEFHPHAEAVLDHALQDLALDLAHDLDCDLLFLLVIGEAEHGILLLQGAELAVGREEVLAGRQEQAGLHDRLQQALGLLRAGLRAQAHARARPRQAGDRHDDAGGRLLQGLVFFSLIETELGRLLGLTLFIRALRDQLAGLQGAAGDLHPGQACAGSRTACGNTCSPCASAAALVGDLVDPGAEGIPTGRLHGQRIQHGQKVVDSLLAKG